MQPEYIASAQDTLRWLGLDWDEGPGVGGPFGPYQQSERLDIYAGWVARFLADGHAYHCYCTTEELEARRQAARQAGGPSGYDGHCRALTAEQSATLVRAIMNDRQTKEFDSTKECNFAIAPPGIGRFRVSAFVQQAAVGCAPARPGIALNIGCTVCRGGRLTVNPRAPSSR